MGPPGDTWLSLFAEPADNKNFSKRKSMFVSTKSEMILKYKNENRLYSLEKPGGVWKWKI
jgi:hypothetical protein